MLDKVKSIKEAGRVLGEHFSSWRKIACLDEPRTWMRHPKQYPSGNYLEPSTLESYIVDSWLSFNNDDLVTVAASMNISTQEIIYRILESAWDHVNSTYKKSGKYLCKI